MAFTNRPVSAFLSMPCGTAVWFAEPVSRSGAKRPSAAVTAGLIVG